MIFEKLLAQLNHPDPQVRLQALQILAMVEETRAINAVLVIYREDPDPQVQQAAKKVGSLLWKVQSTVAQPPAESLPVEEKPILRQMTPIMGKKSDKIAQDYDEMQVALAEAEAFYVERPANRLRIESGDTDDLDLLDAGLIDFF